MLLKGNFETFFFSSILQLISNDRKTGILRVIGKDGEVRIIFKDGDIIYAIGSKKDARLSHVLRKSGIVSEQQLQRCLQLAKEKKQALDRVIVEENLASPESLEKIISEHIKQVIFKIFSWERGEFEYKDVKINLKSFVAVYLNTTGLLLEASRRVEKMSVFKKHVPSKKMIFKLTGSMEDKEEVKLNAEEWRILSLVDGKRSVRHVIKESGCDEPIAYKAFYSLVSSGLVEKVEDSQEVVYKEEKKVDSYEKVPIYSSIITVYLDVLQIVSRFLEADLGRNALSIIEKCKPQELVFHHADIFKNFHLHNPNARNIHVILEAMESIKDVEEGQMFLIRSFNVFLKNILDRSLEVLGSRPSLAIIEKIEQTLFYVEKYQSEAISKIRLVDEIRQVALKLQDHIIYDREVGVRRGGLLSIFGTKEDHEY